MFVMFVVVSAQVRQTNDAVQARLFYTRDNFTLLFNPPTLTYDIAALSMQVP